MISLLCSLIVNSQTNAIKQILHSLNLMRPQIFRQNGIHNHVNFAENSLKILLLFGENVFGSEQDDCIFGVRTMQRFCIFDHFFDIYSFHWYYPSFRLSRSCRSQSEFSTSFLGLFFTFSLPLLVFSSFFLVLEF